MVLQNLTLRSEAIRFSGHRLACRLLKIALLALIILLSGKLAGQCPDRIYFREKISAVYSKVSPDATPQLKELLQIRDEMKRCGLMQDSVYVYLMLMTGNMYRYLHNYDSAVYFTMKAIVLSKAMRNPERNNALFVDGYYALYYYYDALKNDPLKYRALDSCIKYSMKGTGGDPQKALAALMVKTEYSFNKGDYGLCIESSLIAEEIIRKYYHRHDSIAYVSYFISQRANSLFYANDLASAEVLLKEKISEFNEAGYKESTGEMYNMLGLINQNLKRGHEALNYLKKAYKIFKNTGYDAGIIMSLSNIGAILVLQLNKASEGLMYFDRALAFSDIDPDILTNIYMEKGEAYTHLKQFDSAQYYFKLAFNKIMPGSDERVLDQGTWSFQRFDELNSLFALSKYKADAYLAAFYNDNDKSNLKKAISIYKQIDLFLNKIRLGQKLQVASNLIWRNLAKSMYENAIAACYADHNIDDAFIFFENSRAVLLNDQINELRWKADEDIREEADLATRVQKLKQLIQTLPDKSDERIGKQKELYNLERKYDAFVNKLRLKSRLYYQMHLDTTSVDLAGVVSGLLKNDKTLIEIFSGDSAIYVIAVGNRIRAFYKVNKEEYSRLVKRFNSYLSDPISLNRRFNDFRSIAHKLFQLVIPDKNILKARVIISPDGEYFPFEALVMSSADEPDYFLFHHTVSYAYSARYLLNDFSVAREEGKHFLGVAPVDFHKEMNLTRLVGSDQSLSRITRYFTGSDNLLFSDANKDRFFWKTFTDTRSFNYMLMHWTAVAMGIPSFTLMTQLYTCQICYQKIKRLPGLSFFQHVLLPGANFMMEKAFLASTEGLLR